MPKKSQFFAHLKKMLVSEKNDQMCEVFLIEEAKSGLKSGGLSRGGWT